MFCFVAKGPVELKWQLFSSFRSIFLILQRSTHQNHNRFRAKEKQAKWKLAPA